jgi:hypothetical protein
MADLGDITRPFPRTAMARPENQRPARREGVGTARH